MYANAFYWLGILYLLQMPIYPKFHIEVHLRKLFYSAKNRKNKKTPCKFCFLCISCFHPLWICSHQFLVQHEYERCILYVNILICEPQKRLASLTVNTNDFAVLVRVFSNWRGGQYLWLSTKLHKYILISCLLSIWWLIFGNWVFCSINSDRQSPNLVDFSIWENLNTLPEMFFEHTIYKKKQSLIPRNLLCFPCSLDTEFLE